MFPNIHQTESIHVFVSEDTLRRFYVLDRKNSSYLYGWWVGMDEDTPNMEDTGYADAVIMKDFDTTPMDCVEALLTAIEERGED